MDHLLVASGVSLVIGFCLGVLVMALLAIGDSVPTPTARTALPRQIGRR